MGDPGWASGTSVLCSMDVTLLQSCCLGISRCCETVLTRKGWKRCFFQTEVDRENVTKQTIRGQWGG